MCKFCDTLTSDKHNKINWSIRSVFADDNVQDFLDDKFYEDGYIETNAHYGFKLVGYSNEGNTFVSVECKQEYTNNNKNKVVFHPFSEGVQFNFCPICGKQISKDVKKFEEYYEGYISIDD